MTIFILVLLCIQSISIIALALCMGLLHTKLNKVSGENCLLSAKVNCLETRQPMVAIKEPWQPYNPYPPEPYKVWYYTTSEAK